jgi:hypothetical protein
MAVGAKTETEELPLHKKQASHMAPAESGIINTIWDYYMLYLSSRFINLGE